MEEKKLDLELKRATTNTRVKQICEYMRRRWVFIGGKQGIG